MRFCYWSPTAPDGAHADAFRSLVIRELLKRADVCHVAAGGSLTVTACDLPAECCSPLGVTRQPDDVAIYEIDDDPSFHVVYSEALRNPGLLVLREAKLAALTAFLCKGTESAMYGDEKAYAKSPLLSRRLVESNMATLVFDEATRDQLRALVPSARIEVVPHLPPRSVTFAVAIAQRFAELANQERERAKAGHGYLALRRMGAPIAVNAIGSWYATTGLAEAGRRSVMALLDAKVHVSLEECDLGAPTQADRFPSRFHELPRGRPNPIEVCYLNINEFEVISDDYLRRSRRGTYLIGSWYWEMPTLPSQLVRHARRVDEIWVASRFVAQTLGGYTPVPIRIFPGTIEPVVDPSLSRRDFGLPDDTCLFLFNFDAQSTFARKNPWGAIEAFRRAFPECGRERSEGPRLVIKTINLDRAPEGRAELRHELATIGGILIEDNLQPTEMAALVSLCDVYLSLHRSEGFGLGMAEAMFFGKAVIATVYSGNEDFTHLGTSCPVGFRLVEVTAGDLRFNPLYERVYEPGQLWAEPDLDQAATWMRYLCANPPQRKRIGERAAAEVREQFSSQRVGQMMRERLSELNVALAS